MTWSKGADDDQTGQMSSRVVYSAQIPGEIATELLLSAGLCGRTAPAVFYPTANIIKQHKLEFVGELREPDDDEGGLNEVYQASGQLRRRGQPASLMR